MADKLRTELLVSLAKIAERNGVKIGNEKITIILNIAGEQTQHDGANLKSGGQITKTINDSINDLEDSGRMEEVQLLKNIYLDE